MKYLDKHAIITGGSSGIGKAVAILLAQQEANLTLIARDRQKLAIAKEEISAAAGSCVREIFTVSADVANRQEITTAIERAIAQLGTPELLVTSAGIGSSWLFRANSSRSF